MPATSTISDNFNDGSVGAIWAGNYGTTSETGGRARVECGAGFSAFATAASYSLDRISSRAFPAAANGGASSFNYSGMWFVLDGNNRVGIFVDALTGGSTLYFQEVTGGSFNNFFSVAYNATNHAYWDVRTSGSDLLYRTSADGLSWSTQTLTAPAWIASTTTGYVMFEAHRDSGSANNAEWDDFNILPTGAAPSGFAVAVGLGAPASSIPSTAPAGLAVPVALGQPATAVPSAAPSGLAVSAAVGSPAAAIPGATPAGLAVAVACGSPAVALTLTAAPAGLAVPVALGAPTVALPAAAPAGIAVAAAVGAPATALNRSAAPNGLPVAVNLGAPSTAAPTPGITPRPNTGTTSRPNSGITVRPDTGITPRP